MAASIEANITYPIDGSLLDFFSDKGKEQHSCSILNARVTAIEPRLDKEGFCLTTTDSIIENVYDVTNLQSYARHLETILQAYLDAKDTFLIGHIIRKEDSNGEQPEVNRPTASFVHADWNAVRIKKLGKEHDPFVTNNPDATPSRVKQFLEPASQWSIYNIWLPLQTVTNRPLVLCDVQSVKASDIIHDLRFKNTEKNEQGTMGNILSLKYKNDYRWLYYPLMQPNELLIFKQYDSNQNIDNFIPVFHTAFKVIEDPKIKFPMRESIEFRFLVAR
jgi:hypothetical protein